jgi:hypothetical protein
MSEAREEKGTPQSIPDARKRSSEREQGSSAEERRIREEALDKTVEDSFPSSDPPSSIPDPGAEDEAA